MDIFGSARRPTVADLMAEINALKAQIGAQAPAQAQAASPTFFTTAQIKAGGGFPCALGCGKRLRTEKRAASHGEAGHFAAS